MKTASAVLLGSVAFAGLLVTSSISLEARSRHHQHNNGTSAMGLRYGGAPGRGWWRAGPDSGKGFGFATYKGDPFGRDDYYDGDRCYYRKGHDFCVGNRIIDGTLPGRRYR